MRRGCAAGPLADAPTAPSGCCAYRRWVRQPLLPPSAPTTAACGPPRFSLPCPPPISATPWASCRLGGWIRGDWRQCSLPQPLLGNGGPQRGCVTKHSPHTVVLLCCTTVLLQVRARGGPLRVRNYANLAKPEFQVGVQCSHFEVRTVWFKLPGLVRETPLPSRNHSYGASSTDCACLPSQVQPFM